MLDGVDPVKTVVEYLDQPGPRIRSMEGRLTHHVDRSAAPARRVLSPELAGVYGFVLRDDCM